MKSRVVVVGSTHVDLTVYVRELPRRGETVIGREFKVSYGGKGANQAVAAARLGAETFFISRVGNDQFGRGALENLRKNGVRTDFVRVDEEAHTGVALIFVDARGENMIAVAPGADEKVSPGDVESAREAFRGAHALLLQLEIPLETVQRAAEAAKEEGARVILNPAPARKLPESLLKLVDVLTPNEVELEMLSGVPVKSDEDIVKATEKLLNLGISAVVVTLGARGALIVSRDGKEEVPAFKVKPVDTTGAGDAFNGALAVALAEGKSLKDAVLFANMVAAIKVTKPGAQEGLPWRREVEEFAKERGVRI